MTSYTTMNRRSFLSYGFTAGALVIGGAGLISPMKARTAENDGHGPSPLIQINEDNSMIFFYPSPDMGQGTDTSLAMLFMEELDADFDLLTVEPLPYGLKRNAQGDISWKHIPQFSGGSTSIPRNWPLLRQAGATTRQLILQAAAKYFRADISELKTEKSHVISPSGERVSYGKLAKAAATESLPSGFEPNLKNSKDWAIIGRAQKQKVARDIVTGKPLFGMDMDYPGAKVAVVARSPYLDGYVQSLDERAARAVDGVVDIIILDRPDPDKFYTYLAAGVAVIAEDFWTAQKARDLLKITWNKGPYSDESSDGLHRQCDALLAGKGQIVRHDGDFDQAIASADRVISHTYRLPLISHAQLEPQNCIAHVRQDNVTIIAPLQNPGGASRLAAAITGFDRVGMDIRYVRLGGGFGRRLSNDHAAEAVTISKMSGLPIKLIWTREDDLAHDFYRPMGHHQMIAAFDKGGRMTAWAHRLAGTPKYYRRNNVAQEDYFGADLYIDDFPAGLVDNLKLEYFIAKSGTPQGSWRAPAHTANAFVVQSFMDEIALELGEDPLAFRLRMLGPAKQLKYDQHGGPVFDTGRMANVLKAAAKLANWGKKMPPNRAQGIAGHFTFGGYCALVAEVELLDGGDFKVHKVSGAIDVGLVVNPAGVISQMEGGINDGLSTALGQEVLIRDGQMINDNFDRYHMMRMADSIPHIQIHIMDSEASPAGVGEMSLPPLSPAVTNAIARAGGKRLRSHPLRPEE